MTQITVTTSSAAFIEVVDPTVLHDIYVAISSNDGIPPTVEFRPDELTIALVFNDKGEIELSATGFVTELEAVTNAGGKILVTARRPPAPDPQAGGGTPPIDPPPPDTQCPCGGP